MTDAERERLEGLTRRWRDRHDARRSPRVPADADREARARAHFPYRQRSPAEYADEFGAAMIGFTYDDYVYTDPELDAWLVELGRILRERRVQDR